MPGGAQQLAPYPSDAWRNPAPFWLVDPASHDWSDAPPMFGSAGPAPTAPALGRVPLSPPLAPSNPTAQFGRAEANDYRRTFLEAHPELEGKVVVHHAVEQRALRRYPDVVSPEEMHSLENLRGIPIDDNYKLHLSDIRKEWNRFYDAHKTATKDELLEKASEIDRKYGSSFLPPIGGESE
jgi:hypothetical protein